jgi:hypothetical protein
VGPYVSTGSPNERDDSTRSCCRRFAPNDWRRYQAPAHIPLSTWLGDARRTEAVSWRGHSRRTWSLPRHQDDPPERDRGPRTILASGVGTAIVMLTVIATIRHRGGCAADGGLGLCPQGTRRHRPRTCDPGGVGRSDNPFSGPRHALATARGPAA